MILLVYLLLQSAATLNTPLPSLLPFLRERHRWCLCCKQPSLLNGSVFINHNPIRRKPSWPFGFATKRRCCLGQGLSPSLTVGNLPVKPSFLKWLLVPR